MKINNHSLPENTNNDFQSITVFSQDPNKLIRELVWEISQKYTKCIFVAGETDSPRETFPANVEYVVAPSYRRENFRLRVISWLTYTFFAFRKTIILLKKTDLFLFVSSPPFIGILGYLAYFLGKKPYILIVNDIYPDIAESFGLIHQNGLVAKLWRAVNRRTYRHAAYIITLSREMSLKIENQMGKDVSKERIRVVPTWVDTGLIKPINKCDNPFAVQHGLKNKITFMYAGNLGHVADVQLIPRVAEAFSDNKELHFVVIGKGKKFEEIKSVLADKGLENITILPYQPESVLPLMLAAADISLVSVDFRALNCSLPSKTYYNMSAGSALLVYCAKGDELERIIETYQCGVSFQHEHQLIDAIKRFLVDDGFVDRCKINARLTAETLFEKNICISMILELFEKINSKVRGKIKKR